MLSMCSKQESKVDSTESDDEEATEKIVAKRKWHHAMQRELSQQANKILKAEKELKKLREKHNEMQISYTTMLKDSFSERDRLMRDKENMVQAILDLKEGVSEAKVAQQRTELEADAMLKEASA